MMSRNRLLIAMTSASATAVSVPSVAAAKPDDKKKTKGPAKPKTPREIRAQKAFEGANGKLKQAGHHYPTSPKAMQHAGQHKNTGTPKGQPFKR